MQRQQSIVGKIRILIKGAGEMASGVAVRLHRAGFTSLLLLETAKPLAVRRPVSFCEAVYDKRQEVEGIGAELLDDPAAVQPLWAKGKLAVMVDPDWHALSWFSPQICIDATLAKRNLGTCLADAPLVIGLGPGFIAGQDCHCVVETNRGHNLGRVFYSGTAEPNTGIPGVIAGYSAERVLRAPVAGMVEQCIAIGDPVQAGEVICLVGGVPVAAAIPGVVRGCIRPGIPVEKGTKLGDVDPRGERKYCFTVSEKARALGGAVLEAVCAYISQNCG